MSSRAVVLGLALALACAACDDGGGHVARVLDGEDGAEVLRVDVDVASTAEARRQGLVGRPPLAPGEGLVLDFPVEGEVCVVNGGVTYALDVVYAAGDGSVVEVARDVPAGDQTPRCVTPVRRVLEVRAGVAAPVAAGDHLVLD